MQKILLTFALLLASHTASAQPNTVFGLTLGKLLTLPLCAETSLLRLERHTGPTCYSLPSTKPNPERQTVFIALSASQKPEYATDNILTARLSQNQLNAFAVHTSTDPSSQQAIINQLTQQFGKPQVSATVTAQDHQNGDYQHIQIGSHMAFWHVRNMRILYSGSLIDAATSEPLSTGGLLFSFKPAD